MEGRHLTSTETVGRSSTTRLSAYIHFLFRKYRWPVVSKRIHVPTADGRVANVSEFWLEPEFRKRAIQIQQVKDWILEIRRLRAKQRAVVAEKRRRKKSRSTIFCAASVLPSPMGASIMTNPGGMSLSNKVFWIGRAFAITICECS